jgi:hypothetical protein
MSWPTPHELRRDNRERFLLGGAAQKRCREDTVRGPRRLAKNVLD